MSDKQCASASQSMEIHGKELQNDDKHLQNYDQMSQNKEERERIYSNDNDIKEEIVVNLDPSTHYGDDDYINLSCTICKQTYPSIAEVMQHRFTHINPGFYNTPTHPEYNYHSIFDSYSTQNINTNADETDPLLEDSTPSPPKKMTEAEKPFACPVCHKRLSNRSSFSRHTKAHTVIERFPCDICQKVFTRKCHLETHKKLHTGIKPFECQICLKVFSQNSYLKDHQKTHRSEKKYSCSICWKRFKSNSAFRTHEAIVHNGEKKFKCTYENCGKAFTRKAQWQLHERIHSGIKPFQCTVCFRSFARNCTLQEHLLTHSDIKPFYCEQCNKQYARKSQLVLHLRVHNKVKPFACEICNRSYTLQSSLRYHQKAHETGQPLQDNYRKKSRKRGQKHDESKKGGSLFDVNVFICDICGEQYNKKSKIQKHLKRVHKHIFK